MKIFHKAAEIQSYISKFKDNNLEIGFIPTMGALHIGHLELVKTSLHSKDHTVVSIYVNPTQFNSPDDFDKYPQKLSQDIDLLATLSNDIIIFAPQYAEIYRTPDDLNPEFDGGNMATRLEGIHRPGHFKGMIAVVKRLFEIVAPTHAYFGLKDYQQYCIVKQLCNYYNFPIKIVGIDTVREPNGLALSSRNARLSKEGLQTATALYKTLKFVAEFFINGATRADAIEAGKQFIANYHIDSLDYIDICSIDSLLPLEEPIQDFVVLIAAYVEGVRLIDNLRMNIE
jgi:pantoate--beta-alanine ligase